MNGPAGLPRGFRSCGWQESLCSCYIRLAWNILRHSLAVFMPGLSRFRYSQPRPNHSLTRIQSIAADSHATVALTAQAVLSKAQRHLVHPPGVASLRWLATDDTGHHLAEHWEDPGVRAGTLAILQYTSGSTSTPKGVMVTHANLLHNSDLMSQCFEFSAESWVVSWLPPNHDMGLIGGILQPLYHGTPVTLMPAATFLQRPVRWLQAISREQATISGGPNFAYDLCLRTVTPQQRDALDLRHWSSAFCGAEPVRPETLERFAEYFEPCGFRYEAFYPCYGLAEATLLVTGGNKADPPKLAAFSLRRFNNTVSQLPRRPRTQDELWSVAAWSGPASG